MADSLEDIDGIFGESETPVTNALIRKVMKEHPGVSARAQADYYEAVHQELAPLARDFERKIAALRSSREADIERTVRITCKRFAYFDNLAPIVAEVLAQLNGENNA